MHQKSLQKYIGPQVAPEIPTETIEETTEESLSDYVGKVSLDDINLKMTSSRNNTTSSVQYEEVSDPSMHCESTTTINGITYRNYKQGYWEWGTVPYSEGDMSSSACGATSCAVILSGFGSDLTPKDTAEWIKVNCSGAETDAASLVKCLSNFGVPAQADYSSSHDVILEKIRTAWSEGKPVIANVGIGEMTDYGHYIVILGEYNGQVVISQVGGRNYSYIDNGHLYGTGNGDLDALDDNNYIKGVIIPDVVPDGFSLNGGEIAAFEGYEKYQPIVSPATAKILEIGTVTVNNETSESVMDTIYVSNSVPEESETTSTESSETDEENSENSETKRKMVVTQAEYDSIEAVTKAKEADSQNPFGNSYTTGYIKLEIIGSESMEKFKKLNEDSSANGFSNEEYKGFDAFYQDYYKNGKSVCDSHVIYIEGIDLTGELEAGVEYDSIDDLIIGKIFNENSGDENASLAASLLDSGTFTTSDDTVRTEVGNTSTSTSTSENAESKIILPESDILDHQVASLGGGLTGNSSVSGNSSIVSDTSSTGFNGSQKADEKYNWRDNIKYKDKTKYSDEFGTKITLNVDGQDKEYRVNYYTRKEIPEYYVESAKTKLKTQEDNKDRLASIIKINNEIYLKAGTLIGLTGDANIKIIFKDKEEAIVENVEDYLEIENGTGGRKASRLVVDQEYVEDEDGNDVYRLAALMHHEFCAASSYIADSKVRDESGTWVLASSRTDEQGGGLTDISRTCGYVLINRAILDGVLIKDCITNQAYGDAADGYRNANATSGNWCATCLENATWCLTYDCGSVVSSEGIPMTRNCTTQSSFDVDCNEAWNVPNNLEHWWLVDANGDGYVKDHHKRTDDGPMDSFFLREYKNNNTGDDWNSLYNAQTITDYGDEVMSHTD